MKWKDEDLSALRELESTMLQVWRQHPEMNDYTAGRAYAAAFQHYRARFRGHEPKPPGLTRLDLETFQAVQAVCETQLMSGAQSVPGMPKSNLEAIALEKLVDYLRELANSVERHTKLSGRHGYLEFVRSFIP